MKTQSRTTPRERLMSRIDQRWDALVEAWNGIPDKALLQPGVVGHWSIKDLLGHISVWEEECMTLLPIVMEGKRPPLYKSYGGIDAFNDRNWRELRDIPLAEMRRRSSETHRRLLRFLDRVDERFFVGESRFRKRLRLDVYGHYAEHTAHIIAWRTGTPC